MKLAAEFNMPPTKVIQKLEVRKPACKQHRTKTRDPMTLAPRKKTTDSVNWLSPFGAATPALCGDGLPLSDHLDVLEQPLHILLIHTPKQQSVHELAKGAALQLVIHFERSSGDDAITFTFEPPPLGA